MGHYTKGDFNSVDNLAFSIGKARNLIQTQMDAALRGLNVKAAHVGTLMALLDGTSTTSAALSRHLGINTGLMTRMIDKLEALGMVQRLRSHEDRRVVDLELTEAGRAIALRIAEIAPCVLNARLESFTKAEFDELCRLLDKFLGH
ncbi:MarR family transcriptional regulator [Paraburkholderia sp. D15]|uniref:MarR family winged helix-turn-helix transcriptional regulator n=1 Tax=Paraburkholderia sp. D15 TaxID=2880218 RepID=UPI00247B1A73|nr:MarR family transcriptional regulator [Paraburkholderia sp. D15]WGS53324.1 MarR family transcriptional regulator [Paraburkholderia sp. D15]WKF61227.1 Multiple antibiotic resistance protein MarR [Paraburkholderia busanensis]